MPPHAFVSGHEGQVRSDRVGNEDLPAPAGQASSGQLRRQIRDERQQKESSCRPRPLSPGVKHLSSSPSAHRVPETLLAGYNRKDTAFIKAPLQKPPTSRSLTGEGVNRDIEGAALRGGVIAQAHACVCCQQPR